MYAAITFAELDSCSWQELRIRLDDAMALANQREQALLRIAAAGESDDVESLKAAARDGLGIEQQEG